MDSFFKRTILKVKRVMYRNRRCLNNGPLYMIVGVREGFMVEDAVRFYKELPTSIHQQLFITMDENHASVVPTTMSRAFRFCFEVNNG
ncbi:hypothetical protein EC501_09220 [Lysinibacillus halotolerans]|uniref:Alpha/beta hydrolase n=1 Tax=Lysinibacillus halotolerans TaxID=1368476 RepID=A0A3M8H963_9BACI|nr:hypothetical protein EC501_09220 [Lysinibacillus halotolerans]